MRRMLTIAALLIPQLCLAATATTFDFREPSYGRWDVQGWNGVQKTPQGIAVQTTRDGGMFTELSTPSGAQTLSIVATSAAPVELLFLWQSAVPGEGMVQLPVILPQSPAPLEQRIDLTRYRQWNPATTKIGVALPERAAVTLQSISLIRYSPLERAAVALRSLGNTDTFQAFSINFLWGPLVAFTPEELSHLYEGQPPSSWSAMRFLYAAMVLVAAVLYVVRRNVAFAIGATVVAAWLLFDLRMSAELLGYAAHDWSTFIGRPADERVLRDREDLYAVIHRSLPTLSQHPTYALVSPWRITGLVRYLTYPSLPLEPANAAGTHAWLVYQDPAARVDARGRLLRDATVLAESGSVAMRFGTGSFLYVTP